MKKILIVRPGGIGDIALIIPILISLKKYYSNSKITFLSNFKLNNNSSPIDLLFKLKLIDDYFELNNHQSISKFKNLIFFLYKYYNFFDISICLRHSNRTFYEKFLDFLIFKKFLNVPIGLGFWNSSDLSFKKENGKYLKMIKESHRLMSVLKSEGLDLVEENYSKYIYDILKNKTLSIQLNLNRDYILLCPFGKPFKNKINKNWKIENFFELCNELNKRDIQVLFVGSYNDYLSYKNELDKLDELSINLCGKINLVDYLILSFNSKFYLGNDTGPMHLSSITGTPVVAMFNPFNNINKFYPIGNNNLIFRDEISINNIKTQDVMSALINKNLIK